MSTPLILASGSSTRAGLLRRAGLAFDVVPAAIDEDAVRAALLGEGASPRDLADALAEAKARKVSLRHPDAVVLGADQVLAQDGDVLTKPTTIEAARAQLLRLRGRVHKLFAAAVLYRAGRPIWRHVGTAELRMRDFSDMYLDDYLLRNWPGLADTVGAYKLEEEGVRLFARVNGCWFVVLGLPLIDLVGFLSLRGDIPG